MKRWASSRTRVLPKRLRSVFNRILRASHPNAYDIKMGEDSVLDSPRQIDGTRYIQIGDRTRISRQGWLSVYEHHATEFFKPSLVIGSDVYIGNFVCITCIRRIVIEDGCVLSEFVYISDHVHGFNPEKGLVAKQPLVSKGEINIGENTFIGYQACILPGVNLGKHCVVGANSVVTRSFPDYSMVGGAPARLIKTYSFEKHDWIPARDTN